MSIVLYGLGLEVDSGSSLVTFGLSNDLGEGQTIEQAIASAGIENLFVIDFGMGRRKPTAAEFRKFQRIAALVSTNGLQFTERKSKRKGQIAFDVSVAPKLKKAA